MLRCEVRTLRYVYGMFQTREQAEEFLFDMFAVGDVFSSEEPRIEKRGGAFAITLACY